MRALQLSFADNKSTSKKSAKTSKTLNQKKQEHQGPNSAPIYFDTNPLINQITNRAQQKIKRLNIQSGYKQNHLGKAKNILQGLFQRHHEAVSRLQKLREEADINMKVTYPFKPSITKPQKYVIPEGFNRRNKIWIQQKKKRQLQMREESLFEDLSRCPFSPSLVSKYESDMYLKNRQHNRSTQNHRKNKRLCESERERSLSHRQRRDISVIDYEAGKREIFNRLYTDIG